MHQSCFIKIRKYFPFLIADNSGGHLGDRREEVHGVAAVLAEAAESVVVQLRIILEHCRKVV